MRCLATFLAVLWLTACSVYPVSQDPDGMNLRRNANEVMMALQAYHHDKASFPRALSELVPVYLPSLPDSPNLHYSAQDGSLSFRYTPTWPQLRPVACQSVGNTTNWRCAEHLLG